MCYCYRKTRDHSTTENEMRDEKRTAKTPSYRAKAISDDDKAIYINLKKPQQHNTKNAISKPDVKTSNDSQQRFLENRDLCITKTHSKLDGTQSNANQDTSNTVLKKTRQINEDKNNTTFERKKNLSLQRNTDKQQPDKGKKSHLSRHKTHSEVSNDTGTNKSCESKTSSKQTNSIPTKKEHRSRSLHRQAKAAPKGVALENVTTFKDTKNLSESDQVNVHKRHLSKDQSSIRNNVVTIMPKVGKDSSGNKSTYIKEPATRHGSRSSRREYVINYDDKNGTVSSICKIRSGSASPRRKKGAKEVVKEKFKENLKIKSSDKAALRK